MQVMPAAEVPMHRLSLSRPSAMSHVSKVHSKQQILLVVGSSVGQVRAIPGALPLKVPWLR